MHDDPTDKHCNHSAKTDLERKTKVNTPGVYVSMVLMTMLSIVSLNVLSYELRRL